MIDQEKFENIVTKDDESHIKLSYSWSKQIQYYY